MVIGRGRRLSSEACAIGREACEFAIRQRLYQCRKLLGRRQPDLTTFDASRPGHGAASPAMRSSAALMRGPPPV
jgi:hypothetical protein